MINQIPYIGQVFDSLDDVYIFYNGYALQKGFGIRKSSTFKSHGSRDLIRKRFVCDKEGFKIISTNASVDIARLRDTRIGCMEKLEARKSKEGQWIVASFMDSHNHFLDSPRRASKHRSHNKSHKSFVARSLMNQLCNSGLGPSKIARALNTTSGNTSISCQQVIDQLRLEKKNNIGSEGVQVATYLQKQRILDHNFYYAIELDAEGTLKSIFWADSRARTDYFIFSDVIVFDVTYRTNKFLMSFAPFTGVNHHRKSSIFGCALLADETEETFTWLFKQWLSCMLGKSPGDIITDMDGAMYNVIKKVFPTTRHRFCSWHIQKHLLEHIHSISDANSEFSIDYQKWFRSKSVSSCEMRWAALVQKYNIDNSSWLSKMWEQ
ncbi:Protein FAR1-RELATED SEQUENCE 5 [Platanthera zijinensis]|uniref:Protein FAR1-RELATED SEQUENCE 5 n=1 Tax=Platanthera zijinensis TaxID=2320716 RepID=A0AAP0GF13_9ASPA